MVRLASGGWANLAASSRALWPRAEFPKEFRASKNALGARQLHAHSNAPLVFQQIEIDNYQGQVHEELELPFRPSSAPIMRLFGVTAVLDRAPRLSYLP